MVRGRKILIIVLTLITIFNYTHSCVCEYNCDRCSNDCRRCYFCYPGYFTQFGHCVPCAEGCLGCDGASGSCTNCKDGYHWTKGYCEKDENETTDSSKAIIFYIAGGFVFLGAVMGIIIYIVRKKSKSKSPDYEKMDI